MSTSTFSSRLQRSRYWVIDLESSASLTAYRLVGDFGYQDDGEFRGRCTTDTPFTITLPLAELRRT